MYLLRPPAILQQLYARGAMWKGPETKEPAVYLTFDDGPHPEMTPFVLGQLDRYEADATFFCVGRNVVENPDLYDRLLRSRHAIGNHTYNHINGRKVGTDAYLSDVATAAKQISSPLFRPPYGRLRSTQARKLQAGENPFRIVMWSLLSADFDPSLSPEECLQNVVSNARPRDIIVFHDSANAASRIKYALPRALAHFQKKGWKMRALDDAARAEHLPD